SCSWVKPTALRRCARRCRLDAMTRLPTLLPTRDAPLSPLFTVVDASGMPQPSVARALARPVKCRLGAGYGQRDREATGMNSRTAFAVIPIITEYAGRHRYATGELCTCLTTSP